MKKSHELKQERASKFEAQQAIVKKAREEQNRALTEEEQSRFNTLDGELDSLDAAIKAAEKFEARERAMAGTGTSVTGEDGEDKEKKKISKRFSITKMLRQATDGEELDGAEKEMHEIAEQENREAGVSFGGGKRGMRVMVPASFFRATQQTVSQDAGEYGGQLVQNQAPRVVAGLEPKLFIEELGATVLTGLSGGDIPMPVAGSYGFEWLTEGASITPQKNQFLGPVLSPKRAGAAVQITNRLLMQSSVDVDNLVRLNLSKGWANTLNGAAINGAGGNAPTGILNFAGVNAAADVAAAAATFAKIVELQGLIEEDDATERSLAYLMHPRLKAALKTKSKDAGSGRFLIEGNELDGYRFVSTSLVPVGDAAGTPVYPLIYGDFAQMYIGQWGSVSFLVDPYTGAKADSVEIVINTHADVQIANPQAFAKNGFLTNA